MNDDLCFPYFPSSLSLSPPPSFCPFSTRHTACCAHGITADRSLFDQLVMLFLLKIGGREIGGASIPTTRPPIRIIFPFTPFSLSLSLSVHTQRDTGGIYIFHSIDFTLDGDRITWTCNDISVASDPLQLSRRFFVRWKLVRNIGQIFVKCNVR